jgi:hypothetical protein
MGAGKTPTGVSKAVSRSEDAFAIEIKLNRITGKRQNRIGNEA